MVPSLLVFYDLDTLEEYWSVILYIVPLLCLILVLLLVMLTKNLTKVFSIRFLHYRVTVFLFTITF